MRTHVVRPLLVTGVLVAGLAGVAAADVVNGTGGPDRLVGTSSSDTMRGYAGDDILRGRGGGDTLYGGPGNDALHGQKGADVLRGGKGADRLFPGHDSKTDILRGGPGPDRINARVGDDGKGRDYVWAGKGRDRVTVMNSYGWYVPFINCGDGEDTLVLPYGLGMGGASCEHVVSMPSPYD